MQNVYGIKYQQFFSAEPESKNLKASRGFGWGSARIRSRDESRTVVSGFNYQEANGGVVRRVFNEFTKQPGVGSPRRVASNEIKTT